MNFIKALLSFPALFLLFVLSSHSGTAQDFKDITPARSTNIFRSSNADSVFLKIELLNAFYEPLKNNLPYYLASKTTQYDVTASAKLLIKKTQIVGEPNAAIIRNNFGKYLGTDFQLEALESLSRNENLNQYKIIPFRITSSNQIEELVAYDIEWTTGPNNNHKALAAASNFKQNSVLATGNWYKIGITRDGVYRINRSFLANLGINVSTLDPKKIRIYGNGGRMVPELNKAPRIDDLEENPILVVGESDQVFDNTDYILFYASGTNEWKKTNALSGLKYNVTMNRYSDTSFYFITTDLGDGKRIQQKPSLSLSANVQTDSYDYYNFHEDNVINFGKTGRDFYGELFDVNTSYRFSWNDGDFVLNDSIGIEATLLGLHSETSNYSVEGNGVSFPLATSGISGNYPPYAASSTATGWGMNNNPTEVGITASRLTKGGRGWIDKIVFNVRRYIKINGRQFNFRDSRISRPGNICAYTVNNPALAQVQIWNVTNPTDPFLQEYSTSGTTMSFIASADSLNEYCVVPSTDQMIPVYVGKVPNQNLHALQKATYVIVTHPLFIKEAQRLAAFHAENEGLSYAIATTEQIYNEFGGGKQDISAIRDFIRMLYSRNANVADKVKYVLLMGDGSYNNKVRSLVNNSNLIPTYQSIKSLSATESIATDDFYGLMDPNEGANAENSGDLDIGIGRFTCKSVNEVKGIVDKIIHYYAKDANFQANTATPENCNNLNESPMGDWRNWLLFLADDGDYALHMEQSDSLAGEVKKYAPVYNSDKIFLDAYQRFSTPGGSRYPDAAEDYKKRMKKGALIFNYTGHGGEVGLTAERLIDIDLINNLDNYNKLPLFITATCEFSRYDDPGRTSAGELSLIHPKGGAIALMTTSRLAFASANLSLNLPLLKYMFKKLPDGTNPRLGDVIRLTKKELGQNFMQANFHLLGDPALMLAYPDYKVSTSHINNVPVSASKSDTLSALKKITVTGFVTDTAGNKLTGFNGLVYPSVFDKEANVTSLLNDPGSEWGQGTGKPFVFRLQKNMLYRGKARVVNGDFSFTFIVPKDISFAPGIGKISYYATNGTQDAHGHYTNIIVGGDQTNATPDDMGPQVTMFLNDKNFVPGNLTNEKPVFYADLIDSSGINTVGTGLGHDISVVLDENASKPIILNDFYEADLNSYQSGRVRYPFDKLSEGEHRLSFKVWDIHNNSSTVYTDFIVAESAELALKQVLNYPNPFTTKTKFMFQHNQACNPLKVTIQVYTVTGKIVKTIQQSILCEGYRPEGIEWDGRDDFGDKLGRGVYIYRLAILDINNKKAEKIERLVILN
jgi:hypothetical protein